MGLQVAPSWEMMIPGRYSAARIRNGVGLNVEAL